LFLGSRLVLRSQQSLALREYRLVRGAAIAGKEKFSMFWVGEEGAWI